MRTNRQEAQAQMKEEQAQTKEVQAQMKEAQDQMQQGMKSNRQAAQAQMKEAQAQMKEAQGQMTQLSMMIQTLMPAEITQVHTPDNYHSNEPESTNSESYSAQTTSKYKHNTRSSRNEDECKKVPFENTAPMFLNVTTSANYHSTESESTNSESYST